MAGLAKAQTPEEVGRIEGDDFSAKGQVTVVREPGRSTTMLVSGSEVAVRSGYARIALVEGGEVDICGPAQFSLLKSGGAITVALQHGRVHGRVSATLPLSVYTALVVVTPLSIAERPRDVVVGVDAAGAMCVRATHGAVRLEQQLTGQSLLVPQNGELILAGGQLESIREAAGGCRCDVPAGQAESPAPARPVEVSVVAAASPGNPDKEKKEEPGQKSDTEQPVFTAVMPPLTFDASSPVPLPEPSPEVIRLVREVRVRPGVVFSGQVEARPRAEKRTGLGTKIKDFFRRLFGSKPKN